MLSTRSFDLVNRTFDYDYDKSKFPRLKGSVGADLRGLEQDRAIRTDPDETKRRRTIKLSRNKGQSWGFTLQTYGIRNKRTQEVEIMSYVDYIEMNGSAWIAGMRRGDIILSVNGESVESCTHKELVKKIQSSGRELRLVVLFEDCCQKVELHERYLKLKKLLSQKLKELRSLEEQERRINQGIPLSRLDVFRQSNYSSTSCASDWDVYSEITSPSLFDSIPANRFYFRNQSLSGFSFESSDNSESNLNTDNSFIRPCSEEEIDNNFHRPNNKEETDINFLRPDNENGIKCIIPHNEDENSIKYIIPHSEDENSIKFVNPHDGDENNINFVNPLSEDENSINFINPDSEEKLHLDSAIPSTEEMPDTSPHKSKFVSTNSVISDLGNQEQENKSSSRLILEEDKRLHVSKLVKRGDLDMIKSSSGMMEFGSIQSGTESTGKNNIVSEKLEVTNKAQRCVLCGFGQRSYGDEGQYRFNVVETNKIHYEVGNEDIFDEGDKGYVQPNGADLNKMIKLDDVNHSCSQDCEETHAKNHDAVSLHQTTTEGYLDSHFLSRTHSLLSENESSVKLVPITDLQFKEMNAFHKGSVIGAVSSSDFNTSMRPDVFYLESSSKNSANVSKLSGDQASFTCSHPNISVVKVDGAFSADQSQDMNLNDSDLSLVVPCDTCRDDVVYSNDSHTCQDSVLSSSTDDQHAPQKSLEAAFSCMITTNTTAQSQFFTSSSVSDSTLMGMGPADWNDKKRLINGVLVNDRNYCTRL